MKYWLPLPLIFFGVMFYVGNTVPDIPTLKEASSSQKNQRKKRAKKEIVYHEKAKHSEIIFVKKNSDDDIWDGERFETRWHEELFYLLKKLNPERGEEIYYSYLEEKKNHHHQTTQNLNTAINGLSVLNGEIGLEPELEEGRAPASAKDPVHLEKQHKARIKNILGEHYEIVVEQEKLFLEEHPDELTI